MLSRRKAQHPLHHGRRHRLDAAEHLPSRADGWGNAQHRSHRQRRCDLHGLLRRAELHGGAQCLLHRHESVAHRHDPAATAGQSFVSATGTPALAKFLLDLGYNTGEFGKNHLGDHTDALPTAHGFQEFWGYLYHLDAMQEVSFPDINKSPTQQTVAPPCRNTPIPGIPEVPGAVDPKTTICLTPPRNVLWCKCSTVTQEPDVHGPGPAHAGTIEECGRGNLGQGHRLPRSQRSRGRPTSRSSSGTILRACTSQPC